MRRVERDELAREPVGRYVSGETFAHFCATPTLWGVVLWGRPSERDAIELGKSLVLELAPPAVPHVSVVDCSRLDGSHDAAAFRAAERYVTHHHAALRHWVERQALIRPSGLGGALVAGAFQVVPAPYSVRVSPDAASVAEWFVAEGFTTGVADLGAMLAEIYADASSTPQVVGALRAYLDGHLVDVELPAAAKALGMSERTLQRKLGDATTSFTAEVGDARVRAAVRMLVDGDAPLTTIAFEIGCASLQHFGALFRRKTGLSPSAYRARYRGA